MARKLAGGGREPPSSPTSVGYCQPPDHARFRPGQSGNPAGRPKGSRNFKSEIRDALSAEIDVLVDGRQKRVSKFRVILEKLLATASKGDFKAAALIIELGQKFDNEAAQTTGDDIELVPDDRAILDRYVAKCIQKHTKNRARDA